MQPEQPGHSDAGQDSSKPDADNTPPDAGAEEFEVARAMRSYEANPSTANVAALGSGNRKFGFSLFQKLAAANPDKNIVFSPFSISSALAMTYAGARAETEAQMKRSLQFELAQPQLHEAFNATFQGLAARKPDVTQTDGTAFKLSLNNSVWLQRNLPIESPFLDTLAASYDAGLFLANFDSDPEGARNAINQWVDVRTDRLIPELLAPGIIKKTTRLVLTNTVYFDAGWQTRFSKEGTSPGPFTKLDGSKLSVPMMHNTFTTPCTKGTTFDAVALPYEGGKLSFVAIVPKEGSYAALEQSATSAFFDEIYRGLKPGYVELRLPKLEYESSFDLKERLKELDMTHAFDAKLADFSGMSSQRLAIDEVVHKAVIKVAERGTVAAAATAVILIDAGVAIAPPQSVVINFDKPFMYAIFDEPTGEVLFLGRMLDPSVR